MCVFNEIKKFLKRIFVNMSFDEKIIAIKKIIYKYDQTDEIY